MMFRYVVVYETSEGALIYVKGTEISVCLGGKHRRLGLSISLILAFLVEREARC